MKIKYTYTFEVDPKQFPNLTQKQIREEFVATADSYMGHIEQETVNYLGDKNVEED